MTPPLCVFCNAKPVRKSNHQGQRGWRVVDGKKWRWYCSRACAWREIGSRSWSKAVRANHEKAEKRALGKLVALCKDVMDEEQRVPVKALARAWMLEQRRIYAHAYGIGVSRERRRHSESRRSA